MTAVAASADRPGAAHGRLLLAPLARYDDAALALMRVLVGAFLVWGVADNIVSPERMQEFEQFLGSFGFPWPRVMAPLSVWAQFFVGIAFIAGLLTRWAGIVCALNFIVALIMVDAPNGIRAAYPAVSLVLIGVLLATRGAGRYSLDALLARRGRA